MASSDMDAAALVDDAMRCAAEIHVLGERIDAFRRRGSAAIGSEPGPEVALLREQQTGVVERFLEHAGGGDVARLHAARRRLRETYAERNDLVAGRALALVEAALDRAAR